MESCCQNPAARKRRKYSEVSTNLRRSKSLPDKLNESKTQYEYFTRRHSKSLDSSSAATDDRKHDCKKLLFRAMSNAQVQSVLLRDAIKENSRYDLMKLLSRKHSDINMLGVDGLAAIHFAAMQGTPKILEILISKGAVVDTRSGSGEYALDLAVKSGNYEIAQYLIEKGARLDNVINGTPPTKPKHEGLKRRSNTINCG